MLLLDLTVPRTMQTTFQNIHLIRSSHKYLEDSITLHLKNFQKLVSLLLKTNP